MGEVSGMDFETAVRFVLAHEGGYRHHRQDPGGETRFGISKRVARAHGYRLPMRVLSQAEAVRIYRQGYWRACRCDDLPDHPLRLILFDAAVHSGVGQAVKWLQAALGVKVDGQLGPVTLGAVAAAHLDALAASLIDRRESFLRALRTWPTFGRGWTRRLADLRAILAG